MYSWPPTKRFNSDGLKHPQNHFLADAVVQTLFSHRASQRLCRTNLTAVVRAQPFIDNRISRRDYGLLKQAKVSRVYSIGKDSSSYIRCDCPNRKFRPIHPTHLLWEKWSGWGQINTKKAFPNWKFQNIYQIYLNFCSRDWETLPTYRDFSPKCTSFIWSMANRLLYEHKSTLLFS